MSPTSQQSQGAAQVAAFLVAAGEMLFPRTDERGGRLRFLNLLRATGGVKDVRTANGRDRPGKNRFTIALPEQPGAGATDEVLTVEVADPNDRQWVGGRQRRRLESALRLVANAGAFEQAKDLLERSPLLIAHLEDTRWTALSEVTVRLLGAPTDPSLAAGPLAMVDPRDRAAALRAFVSTARGYRRRYRTELRVRSVTGSTMILDAMFFNLSGIAGLSGALVVAMDGTPILAGAAALRELAYWVPGGAAVVDERGKVVAVNNAFAEFAGIPEDRWPGSPEDRVLRAVADRCGDRKSACRHLISMLGSRRGADRLGLADGGVVVAERHPLVERALELGALWRFEVMAGPAEPGDGESWREGDHQNRVIAMVSHEFRTPLTALLSFADLIADQELGGLSIEQQSAADVIKRNAGRLLRLVDDLLLLTRLRDRQLPMRFVEVRVPELIRAAVVDRRLEIADSDVDLRCADDGPPIHADPGRLHQVLGNVLGNAVKYSKPGGRIHVSAGLSGDVWAIEVTDSGIGIPPDEIATVLKGFARGSNAIRDGIAGTGLGLALSKEIVELHGGKLAVDSVLNVGTTVRIELPVERRRQP